MELFEIASTYASFGYHRTGSESQLATEKWLVDCLGRRANFVDLFTFEYLHFDATTKLTQGGRTIQSMALYYEAVDEIKNSDRLAVAIVDSDNEADAYSDILSLAKRAKDKNYDALIVATICNGDSLYAFNVNPQLNESIPVVLVPGFEFEGLDKGNISLDYSAQVSRRKANNIIARFGVASYRPSVVITTPITGWFECAGERGTGIALAITLAEELSKDCEVELVLASGHELGYLGGFEFVASLNKPPTAVIHLGSSLATFNSKIQAWSNMHEAISVALESNLQQLDIPLNRVRIPGQRSDWVGEAECWARFNCPMLSIAGDHPQFHTPADQIDCITDAPTLIKTSEVLTRMASVVTATI